MQKCKNQNSGISRNLVQKMPGLLLKNVLSTKAFSIVGKGCHPPVRQPWVSWQKGGGQTVPLGEPPAMIGPFQGACWRQVRLLPGATRAPTIGIKFIYRTAIQLFLVGMEREGFPLCGHFYANKDVLVCEFKTLPSCKRNSSSGTAGRVFGLDSLPWERIWSRLKQ